ncbi:hypothetical protein [Agilicoccus flavus]|uniref:hypothetical protein n=1 Tax=Agilicoccus flavus TaxID=2775968 RepID=UPI001CF6620E|nr:hypothetical protein [Agilicoccus flavus]
MNDVWPYLMALAPPVGVGFLFYLVIKAIVEGDRKERLAQSRWEAQHGDAAGGTAPHEPPADRLPDARTRHDG